MRFAYLFILFLLQGIAAYAQKPSPPKNNLQDVAPYDYQTKLSGGYRIVFDTDDSLEYLHLVRKNKTITELASGEKGMLYKSLGYVGADFSAYFVLVHSFGSGNPHEIELIKKATGANVLKTSAWWIDAAVKNEALLYSNQDVPTAKDRMILYYLKTGLKRYLPFPKDIFNEPMILNNIQIKTLTNKVLIIEYSNNGQTKTKRYAL